MSCSVEIGCACITVVDGDVMIWKRFPHYWIFVQRSSGYDCHDFYIDSLTKGFEQTGTLQMRCSDAHVTSLRDLISPYRYRSNNRLTSAGGGGDFWFVFDGICHRGRKRVPLAYSAIMKKVLEFWCRSSFVFVFVAMIWSGSPVSWL